MGGPSQNVTVGSNGSGCGPMAAVGLAALVCVAIPRVACIWRHGCAECGGCAIGGKRCDHGASASGRAEDPGRGGRGQIGATGGRPG